MSKSHDIAKAIAAVPFLAWGITINDIRERWQVSYWVAAYARHKARRWTPHPIRHTIRPDTSLPRSSP